MIKKLVFDNKTLCILHIVSEIKKLINSEQIYKLINQQSMMAEINSYLDSQYKKHNEYSITPLKIRNITRKYITSVVDNTERELFNQGKLMIHGITSTGEFIYEKKKI